MNFQVLESSEPCGEGLPGCPARPTWLEQVSSGLPQPPWPPPPPGPQLVLPQAANTSLPCHATCRVRQEPQGPSLEPRSCLWEHFWVRNIKASLAALRLSRFQIYIFQTYITVKCNSKGKLSGGNTRFSMCISPPPLSFSRTSIYPPSQTSQLFDEEIEERKFLLLEIKPAILY